jgi:glycine/D-amino acid oxidase-like deaminating enzyme
VNGQVESFGFFRRRLMHIFLYASMSQKLTSAQMAKLGGENYWGLIPADPLGSTVRRFGDRIVVRNSCTYNSSMRVSEDLVKNFGKAHDRSFGERFPMLPDVQAEFRWAGHLCLSLNSAPAFGEIEQGIYSACCCNGLGTVKGTLYGKLIADLAAGSGEAMVEEALSEPAPRKLYPEPFMSLGAAAKLWWLQKRAGREM